MTWGSSQPWAKPVAKPATMLSPQPTVFTTWMRGGRPWYTPWGRPPARRPSPGHSHGPGAQRPQALGRLDAALHGGGVLACELAQLLVVGLDQIRAAGQSFPQGAAAGIHNHFLALRLGQAAQGGVEVPRHALGHAAGNGHHFRLPQLALVVRQEALQLPLGDGVARLQELGALVCLPVPDVDAAAGLPRTWVKAGVMPGVVIRLWKSWPL